MLFGGIGVLVLILGTAIYLSFANAYGWPIPFATPTTSSASVAMQLTSTPTPTMTGTPTTTETLVEPPTGPTAHEVLDELTNTTTKASAIKWPKEMPARIVIEEWAVGYRIFANVPAVVIKIGNTYGILELTHRLPDTSVGFTGKVYGSDELALSGKSIQLYKWMTVNGKKQIEFYSSVVTPVWGQNENPGRIDWGTINFK